MELKHGFLQMLKTASYLCNDFAIFRKDRNESRGGGVLIAIRSDYQPALVSLDNPTGADLRDDAT